MQPAAFTKEPLHNRKGPLLIAVIYANAQYLYPPQKSPPTVMLKYTIRGENVKRDA